MTSPRPHPVLEVIDLQIGFPQSVAVQGISFAIERGETMALVGESGCGKSLTAFSILRLLPPTASIIGGQVIFDGLDLATASARRLRQIRGKGISIVLQEPMTSLNPVLTIGTQIREVILRHEGLSRRKARNRAIELLDLVGISEPHRRYDQIPHHLSGGMRQRVMIAMAVACNPQLLIADEPTTALNVTIQAQVMDLLDRLRRQLSMAMLLITHDLGGGAMGRPGGGHVCGSDRRTGLSRRVFRRPQASLFPRPAQLVRRRERALYEPASHRDQGLDRIGGWGDWLFVRPAVPRRGRILPHRAPCARNDRPRYPSHGMVGCVQSAPESGRST